MSPLNFRASTDEDLPCSGSEEAMGEPPRLIDAIPDKIQPIGGGWRITFGDETRQDEIGCVYLLKNRQYYVRFKVMHGPGKPLPYKIISERPLTEEEITHFEALVKGQ